GTRKFQVWLSEMGESRLQHLPLSSQSPVEQLEPRPQAPSAQTVMPSRLDVCVGWNLRRSACCVKIGWLMNAQPLVSQLAGERLMIAGTWSTSLPTPETEGSSRRTVGLPWRSGTTEFTSTLTSS